MNKSNLKRYAPQARKDFIAAVTGRAHLLGLSAIGNSLQVEPCTVSGDAVLIGGRAWPVRVKGQRELLVERMRRDGFDQTLEAVAYTWFNRLAALRYMELHDYLGHGRRVLSNPEGGLPEVLAHAVELAEAGELPGLGADTVRQLKLDNKDGELYRRVLVAQCNALNRSMPFLFEAIDDETELLLPENLLLSDSIIAKLVAGVPEGDWTEVEAIGWLYQFYISEKKDQVIGKVVKSEDIPAATQLFTPNWIVQYLVQNSVGRLWLMANPTSTLASQWPYYIQPTEQTAEVRAQLDVLIQARISEDGGSLNPETIAVLDPACGSGHILVEAYEVLKAIYLERGYQPRAIPRLILEKNLYGLDIDDRAAQMACFALLMKARKEDRRLLNDPPQLNVRSLQESKGINLNEVAAHLTPFGAEHGALKALLDAFEHAKTFGSLTRVAPELTTQLSMIGRAVQRAQTEGDLYAQHAARDVAPLVWQALVLAKQFDAVVANPPYMGGKGMNSELKEFARAHFPDSKSDLFAMFMERAFEWCKPLGFSSLITMQSWMFLSSFQNLREKILASRSIQTMAHFGARAFSEISGEVVQTTAFVLIKQRCKGFRPVFFRLTEGSEDQKRAALTNGDSRIERHNQDAFSRIPGTPLAYWATVQAMACFDKYPKLDVIATPCQGLATTDNGRFVRYWYEVPFQAIGLGYSNRAVAKASGKKWFPFDKGGEYRRWAGNELFIVNWQNDGEEIKSNILSKYSYLKSPDFVAKNPSHYFKPGVTWGKITSGLFSARFSDVGAIFSDAGMKVLSSHRETSMTILGLLNCKVAPQYLGYLSGTLNFEQGNVARLPVDLKANVTETVERLVEYAKRDWDDEETSRDFKRLKFGFSEPTFERLSDAWEHWNFEAEKRIAEVQRLETINNQIFIQAYGLQEEICVDVPENQITLARADREEDCKRLVSYVVGCTLGRYSLNEPGLIYAHAGNASFDPRQYTTFPADIDGVVPVTQEHWFEDDAGSRVTDFVRTVWGEAMLQENLAWLAESLGRKASDSAEDAIRRYLADKFFKDHLQTYKKRPIYWLFSSGKQGAFQALVYLHRYHEGTLARMRSEYVLPLTGKMHARIDTLQADIRAASSTAARNRLTKQLETLRKQLKELLDYDEKLRHYADQRIVLDLDDGVKQNYARFGDLLAEVKAVTGGSSED